MLHAIVTGRADCLKMCLWLARRTCVSHTFSADGEGSAGDGHTYQDAHCKDLAVPPGKFFLADAGFSACDTLLIPYRGERYHLREQGKVGLR